MHPGVVLHNEVPSLRRRAVFQMSSRPISIAMGVRLNICPTVSAQQRIADAHLHRGCGRVRLRVQTQRPLKHCHGLSVVDSRYFHSESGSFSTRSRAISKPSKGLRSEHRTFLRAQFFFQNFLCLPFFHFEHCRPSSFTTRR